MALARLLSRPKRRLLGTEPSGIVEIAASTFQGETKQKDLPVGTGIVDKPCPPRLGEQGRQANPGTER